MNKIFWMLTLFSCVSASMAEDAPETTLLTDSAKGMVQKNGVIMSSFDRYFSASRKQEKSKLTLASQQYTDFLKNKRAL